MVYCVQDEQVDPADLFDDADDGMLLDAANESDGGGSIPGIDTDVDEDDEDDDKVSTADSVKPVTSGPSSLPGISYELLLIFIVISFIYYIC